MSDKLFEDVEYQEAVLEEYLNDLTNPAYDTRGLLVMRTRARNTVRGFLSWYPDYLRRAEARTAEQAAKAAKAAKPKAPPKPRAPVKPKAA
jgi:hypothetical protein